MEQNKGYILEFHIKEYTETEEIHKGKFPISLEDLTTDSIDRAFGMGKNCVLKYLEYQNEHQPPRT